MAHACIDQKQGWKHKSTFLRHLRAIELGCDLDQPLQTKNVQPKSLFGRFPQRTRSPEFAAPQWRLTPDKANSSNKQTSQNG